MTPLQEAIALVRGIFSSGFMSDVDTLDDDELIALRLILAAAEEAEGLRAALTELIAAADDYLSSDIDMPSHDDTEVRMENTLEAARAVMRDKL